MGESKPQWSGDSVAPKGTIFTRIEQMERNLEHLEERMDEQAKASQAKIDRLTFSLIGFALTVAGSAAAVIFVTGTPGS